MPTPALILALMAPMARSGGRTSRSGPEAAAAGLPQPRCDRFWFAVTRFHQPRIMLKIPPGGRYLGRHNPDVSDPCPRRPQRAGSTPCMTGHPGHAVRRLPPRHACDALRRRFETTAMASRLRREIQPQVICSSG
jgi:hypothetical protein